MGKMEDYDPEKEEKDYRPPLSRRHPLLFVGLIILATSALGIIFFAAWSMILGNASFWSFLLAIVCVIGVCHWWIRGEQKKVARLNGEENPVRPEKEYRNAYRKTRRKKIATPPPDTMTDEEIKKKVKGSPRIQDFLKRRKESEGDEW